MYTFIKHKVTSNIHKYSNQNSTIHKNKMRNIGKQLIQYKI